MMTYQQLIFEVQTALGLAGKRSPGTAQRLADALAALLSGHSDAEGQAQAALRDYDPRPSYLRCNIQVDPDEPLPVACGVSTAFRDKSLMDGYGQAAYTNSFKPTDTTFYWLVRHIRSGGAWCVARLSGNRRTKANFESSQIVGLDFDDGVSVDDVLSDPFMRSYAAFVHPSSSSTPGNPKTRAVFRLQYPVLDGKLYEGLVKAMLDHLSHFKPDAQASDCVRIFYGSTSGLGVANFDAVLPAGVCDDLVGDYEARQEATRAARARPRETMPMASDNATKFERYALATLDGVVRDLSLAPGGDRNNTLFKAACRLFGMARGGWPGLDEGRVLSELQRSGEACGLPSIEVTRTIASARNTADAIPVQL